MGDAAKKQVAAKAAQARAGNGNSSNAPAPTSGTIVELLAKPEMKAQIARALPKAMTADRFARVVLTVLRTTPKLMQCNPQSVLAAVMRSAQLGLEPGPLGHAYFVPYNQECTFIIGYRGMIDLARRTGEIESVVAREVHENDEFEIVQGTDEHIRHVPLIRGERGEVYAYYGVARFKGGGHTQLVLSREDVEKFRARSKAKNDGPWKTDYDAMAKKTVIRRMSPYLPMNVEAAAALAVDETSSTKVDATLTDLIEVPDVDDAIDVPEVAPDKSVGDQADADTCPVCGAGDGEDHNSETHKKFDEQEAGS